ncbi:MAG: ABC transporter permease [Lachnospiraceae bacterium]|nr:ABC transporter permease [Lachnospiraceae bacterium]
MGEIKYKLKNTGGFKSFILTIWNNMMSRAGFIILCLFLMVAILGPMILEQPKADYLNRLKPPSMEHLLGTDYSGRDTLIQLILGSRDVLLVAFWAGIISIVIACSVGIIAGLLGGRVDSILMLISNVVITIPSFPVTMILSMLIHVDNELMFGLLLSLWSWAGLAKAIRSQVLTIKHKDFIEASRILGLRKTDIIINDILPNIISYIAVNFIAIMKGAIMASVGLMYLGLVPFQGNHWGMMIQLSLTTSGALMGSGTIAYFLGPVVGIILFQLGCYLFATGLDEALNPRLRV